MIRYAATSSDGSRSRAITRESIDHWAADKCAEGCVVEVWWRDGKTQIKGIGSNPERVGLWLPDDSKTHGS